MCPQDSMPSSLYSRLPESQPSIRLLSLFPATEETALISCLLKTVPLDGCPQFEALSYVWGDAKVTKTITVEGHSFHATVNLADALFHLRYADRPRLMWIDAVCIDQSNLIEREHQVALMGRIYTSADEVVVWLGKDDHQMIKADLGMATIRAFGEDSRLHWDQEREQGIEKNLLDSVHIASLCDLLQRPWWDRVWTVQELVLGRCTSFVCGNATCSGEAMLQAAGNFMSHINTCCQHNTMGFPNTLVERAYEANFLLTARSQRPTISLVNLMVMFRHRSCTVPHDRIYGFFGISTDVNNADLISYSKPFVEVCAEVAHAMIQATGRLDVLNLVFDPSQITSPLQNTTVVYDPSQQPTWFPQWDQPVDRSMQAILLMRTADPIRFKASLNLPLTHEWPVKKNDPEINCLGLRGMKVDEIRALGIIMRDRSGKDFRDALIQWRAMLPADGCPDIDQGTSGRTYERLFWDIVSGGMFAQNMDPSVFVTWWQDSILDGKPTQSMLSDGTRMSETLAFDTAVQVTSTYRRYFVSAKGRMGLVPAGAVAGDRIYVVPGSGMPLVLRPVSRKDWGDKGVPFQQLLGPAYVEGIMYGELGVQTISEKCATDLFII